MPLNIKISGPSQGQSSILRGLPDDITLQDLKVKIAEATGLSPPEQRLRVGFPPKDVEGNATDEVPTLGIQSGGVLSLLKKEGVAASASSSSNGHSIASSSANGSSNQSVQNLVDMGFSHRVAAAALEMANNDFQAAFELCIGGVVTEEALGIAGPSTSTSASSNIGGKIMVKRVIDADNSCLFNAVAYCMERNKTLGSKLRKIIADTVRNNQTKYSEAVLGKSPKEYSDWILDPKNWGGEIELFILSQYYGAEIVAVEIRSKHAYVYGEDSGYTRRIYVLYDGVHYDALALATSESAAESQDVTQFSAKDEASRTLALELAARLATRRQYVDTTGFNLRCMVCDKAFVGQEQALAHARATSHQNFGEVGV